MSLANRGDVIFHRRRYGDWEGDTLVGHGRRSALVTLVDRKSGYARIGRVDDMKSATTMRVIRRRMKQLPPSLRRSMTLDNGQEFAEQATLRKQLRLKIYFAAAYASWQRGSNENTNGLWRQLFPQESTSRRLATARWPSWRNFSTTVLADDSTTKRPTKSSPNECVAIDS